MTVPGHGHPSYAAAGRRHLDDGHHLFANSRSASADHLAGLAAECLLKAIVLDFFNASMVGKFPSISTGSTTHKLYHLPNIWQMVADHVALHARGRNSARFINLMNSRNPFIDWSIEHRYSDGTHLRFLDVAHRLKTARSIAATYQDAQLTGSAQ